MIPQLEAAKLAIKANWVAIRIGLYVLFLAAIFGSGLWLGYDYRDGKAAQEQNQKLQDEIAAKNEAIRKRNEVQADLNALQTEFQDFKDNLQPEVIYVTKQVTTEVEKPVYRECVLPPSGVQIHSDTVRRLNEQRRNSR
jgi:hypothetical protein